MVRNQKLTGRASSMPAGLFWGAGVSLGITMLGTAVIAKMMLSETLQETMTGYGVMVMLILGAFAGALTAAGKVKRQRLIVCAISGGIYFLMLMSITALFFGGQYEAVGVTGMLVFCGSMLAVLTEKRPSRAGKRKKYKIANR